MLDRQTIGAALSTPLVPPFMAFAMQACALGVALAYLSEQILPTPVWALAAFLVAVSSIGLSLANGAYPHITFGLCNTVTLARATMVAFLFGTLFAAHGVSPWLVGAVAVVAFALDGVDGWLARRTGLLSDFGARFDVETDAAFAAVLAVWLIVSGTTGPEVLVLGFARYVFVAAGWVLPQLRAELPPSMRRKTVCVLQIAALIALSLPILPAALILPLSIGASLAVCYSFAVDLRWLLRRAD